MGNCKSTSIVAAATSNTTTAKLILQDRQLQELSSPIRVFQVLHNHNIDQRRFAICDSEDMEFGECISRLNWNQELRVGRLYFVLPLSCLNSLLGVDDLAALAVKASLALGMMSSSTTTRFCRGCGFQEAGDHDHHRSLVFTTEMDVGTRKSVATAVDWSTGGGIGRRVVRKRRREGAGGARGFTNAECNCGGRVKLN